MSQVGALVTQFARGACERDHIAGKAAGVGIIRTTRVEGADSRPRRARDHALHRDAEAVRVLGSAYINAIASKLEHNTTRPAATSARNPSDTKSSLRMVHLPMAMLVRIY